jgi:alanyl-tRNA synthetase
VRRIEAVCGRAALEAVTQMRRELGEIKAELKNNDAVAAIGKLKDEIKTLKNELKAALSANKKELTPVKIGDIDVIIDEVEAGDIKEMIDDVKNRFESIAVMLFQKKGDKVVLAAGSKNTPVKAGDWIKAVAPVLGGGGGGRADFAQAGGKDASKIPEAMEEAKKYIEMRS